MRIINNIILNSFIRNGTKTKNTSYLEYYIENEEIINKMEDVVNGFNKFLVNLAEIIKYPETTEGWRLIFGIEILALFSLEQWKETS